ncbi:unnamed protein product [Malassezia sympodialis ATCC 42132]|uniref:uncharacterized protein n=1 Tax=Malassezia sympodialis (strain ATCC 42132) TaxID=1230383 RepID=UPI0002C19C54|nr:uncharacterized protein MSY001_3366 [Malassezia sympodialis ATCC 42132]CCV00660.1 unnamed protein product [Malassezia sympodialis ATCC 42132]|eukprot:XP_018741842.1 uncharacterized protein MSY001_3366 [Malassezia sympodialis ATCC 42132]
MQRSLIIPRSTRAPRWRTFSSSRRRRALTTLICKKLGVRFVQVGHRGLTRTTFEQGLQSWRKGRHH